MKKISLLALLLTLPFSYCSESASPKVRIFVAIKPSDDEFLWIKSIQEQTYSNWCVTAIVVKDSACVQKLERSIAENNLTDKITITDSDALNRERGPVERVNNAISPFATAMVSRMKDQQFVFEQHPGTIYTYLDGDDSFANSHVLQQIIDMYQAL